VATCVYCALVLSGCVDTGGDPLATAVAPETHGAILFSEGLSTLPQLLLDHGLAAGSAAETEAWWDSWQMDEEEGARLRGLSYGSAIHRLYSVMGPEGLEDVLDRNSLSLISGRALGDLLGSESVSRALGRAEGFQQEARSALRQGDGERALLLALREADALWEVTPEHVASELIQRAEEALGRNPRDAPYSEEELVRIRRLMYGAAEALRQKDYPGAIRRAYYACQLLGVDPP
jgi:hypothetical protein